MRWRAGAVCTMLIWFVLLCITMGSATAQEAGASTGAAGTGQANGPKTVRIGLFIDSIYDIDFANDQFKAQFWLWADHDLQSLSLASLDILHDRTALLSNISRQQRGERIWDSAKVDASLIQPWDVTYYPFDRQVLRIMIESADAYPNEIKFEPDIVGSKYSRRMVLEGWQIENFRFFSGTEEYETAYGDPALKPEGPSRYSRVTAELQIKRHGWRLFVYNFNGFFFAMALAALVLLINSSARLSSNIAFSVRIALSTGSLFSAVGASYVLQARLPYTASFTLADAIQGTAFLGTLLAMLSSICVEYLDHTERHDAAMVSARSLLTFFALLLVGTAVLVVVAARS